MGSRKALCAVVFLCLLASVSMAGFFGTDVKVSRVVPPTHVLTGVKSIGVVNFSGPGSDVLMPKFLKEATMSNRPKGAGSASLGSVVDVGKSLTGGILGIGAGLLGGEKAGQAVQEAVAGKAPAVIERGLKTNPFDVKQYNDAAAAKSGGAQVIVTCALSSEGMKHRDYQAKEIRYVNGKKQEHMVDCREVTLSVKGAMKVLDATNDNLIFTKDLSGSSGKSACGDGRSSLPGEKALADEAVAYLAGGMADEIIPYIEPISYDLEKDKIVKKGREAAKDGKYEDAIDQFRIAIKADNLNYAANYNLGTMEEVFGDYDNALKHFNAADKLQSSKESKEAIGRVNMRIAQVKQLEGLGMKLEPYVAAEKGVKVPKFLVKGDNKDRYDLLAEPKDGAAKACTVAGGMQLDYVTKQEGWVKLKCIDGATEGWIKLESVKMMD